MERQVHVLGKPRVQNKLMANYLSVELGLTCDFRPVDRFQALCAKCTDEKCLVLCDCQDSDLVKMWQCLGKGFKCQTCGGITIFFNVKPGTGVEYDALRRNVRGILYKNDSLAMLTKGINSVLEGELWFSRRILAKSVTESAGSAGSYGKPAPRISPREKELLDMIATGSSNEEIVDRLCISLHTVKTHLHNIYKKINVHNRTQAAVWTLKNL